MAFAITALVAPKPVMKPPRAPAPTPQWPPAVGRAMPAAQSPTKPQSRRPQAALPKHTPSAPTHPKTTCPAPAETHPMSTASPYVGWAKAAGRAHAEGTASPLRRALRARRAPATPATTPQLQTPVGRAMPAAQGPIKPQSRRPQAALPKHTTTSAPTPQRQPPVGRAMPAAQGPIKHRNRRPRPALLKHTTNPAPTPQLQTPAVGRAMPASPGPTKPQPRRNPTTNKTPK